MKKVLSYLTVLCASVFTCAGPAFAESAEKAGGIEGLAVVGLGILMGLAALGGALGQGKAISAALDSIGRNPSAAAKMNMPLILGLVFIETLVIFSFVIAFMALGKA